MGKMSRDKGARFEREVCKLLSGWWGAEFQRTPQSGGSRLAEGWQLGGDVACSDPGWPFHVECKHVEGWELSHLLTHKDMGLLGKWLAQACDECPGDLIPLVVFKKNRHPVMAMLVLPKRHDLARALRVTQLPGIMETPYGEWQALFVMQLSRLFELEAAIFEKPWD